MKHKKTRRVFRAQMKRTNHHIVLIDIHSPLVRALAATLLPLGAMVTHTEDGSEVWVYRTSQYQPPLSYRDTSGEPLITLRSIPENGDEWRRLRRVAEMA